MTSRRSLVSLVPNCLRTAMYAGLCLALLLGEASSAAAQDPRWLETGVNDFQISHGPSEFSSGPPAVAYNSRNNEYLVVWRGYDGAPLESEVWGQRIDAATGAEVGTDDFRISDMGPNGDTDYEVSEVAVAYNSTNNEYLVCWSAADDTLPTKWDVEIFCQLLNAATGAEVGQPDFQVSEMGPTDTTDYNARHPAIAYNSTNNEYLVVWQGADVTKDDVEIWGQRLDATNGFEIGTQDFQISNAGPVGNSSYVARHAEVAYNRTDNEYLVVWDGTYDVTNVTTYQEHEIWGQRLNAATGADVGADDFRISDMGPDDDGTYVALFPALAYNGRDNEYLVVWEGDDDTGSQVEGDSEIWGQRIAGDTGAEAGTNDFAISSMGGGGVSPAFYSASLASVAFRPDAAEYLVVWRGDDDLPTLVNDELEVFGQVVDASGVSTGLDDFRISDMGTDGDKWRAAQYPCVAFASETGEYLVAWLGDDVVDNYNKVFGQLIASQLMEIFIWD